MHQSVSLITTIAAAFGLALVLGFVAARLKMPALVGYLAAGIIIGPQLTKKMGSAPATIRRRLAHSMKELYAPTSGGGVYRLVRQ